MASFTEEKIGIPYRENETLDGHLASETAQELQAPNQRAGFLKQEWHCFKLLHMLILQSLKQYSYSRSSLTLSFKM